MEPARSIRAAASVAVPGLDGEELLVFPLDAIHLFGVGQGIPLDRDVRPDLGELSVYLEPFVEPRLGVRLYGLGGTFRLANAAIYALVRMDDEEVLTFIETVDRTYLDAISVLAADTIIGHDICHEELQIS